MMLGSLCKDYKGVTLIELIVAMVVIAVALTGVLSVINYTVTHSADPVVRHQAIAIAEAYMEEITLKDIADPDGLTDSGGRTGFDDVDDYNGLVDNGAVDQSGNTISGLADYRVSVTVTAQSYGPVGNQVSGRRIEVQVDAPSGESLSLVGYRAAF